MPPWLANFGPYPERNARGGRNLLITGNMPGRCDAGRIWQARFDFFLRGYGLRQCVTDRRVWSIRSARGVLVIHGHVDDSRLTSTTPEARSHFYRARAAKFNSPPEPAELSENFTGLRHHPIGGRAVEISCLGVLRALEEMLLPYAPDPNMPHDVPLSADALSRLREPPSAKNPLMPHLLPEAQHIGGTIGFITNMVRCDFHFPYCVLSRHLNEGGLTALVFRLLLRVGRYLVSTNGLCLTVVAPVSPASTFSRYTPTRRTGMVLAGAPTVGMSSCVRIPTWWGRSRGVVTAPQAPSSRWSYARSSIPSRRVPSSGTWTFGSDRRSRR